jgi:hypothetical protein
MRKASFLFMIYMLFAIGANGQQALFGGGNIVSPEINSDNTVTFRFVAPSADEVKISGDWMPAEGRTPGSILMTKG